MLSKPHGSTSSSGSSVLSYGNSAFASRRVPLPMSASVGDYEYAYSADRNSNGTATTKHLGHHNPASQQQPFSDHFYEQPMVVFPSSSSGQNSPTAGERVPFLPPRSSPPPPPPPSHLQLPRCADEDSVSWLSVSSVGARITVPRSSASLTVPQGALTLQQDMYMALLDKQQPARSYRPKLDSSQTAVTPVVQCGPANITHCLQKPVVLSIPHVLGASSAAGSNVRGKLTVLYCADPDHDSAEWQVVRNDGESDVSKIDMQVDPTSVHLVTERLGAYVLVASVNDINQIGGGNGGGLSSRSSSGCSSLNAPQKQQQLSSTTKLALSRLLDEGSGWPG